ncbi:hypothetical protein KCP71_14735 [Salmonella enterica subsp. enterica]|nr:hypothetical protein KCP71_14735 [Salmonella enterica subsp. enterica]
MEDLDIDVVILSGNLLRYRTRNFARILGKPYRRGFVRVTWDVPLSCRANSYAVNPCAVNSTNRAEFRDKNVTNGG